MLFRFKTVVPLLALICLGLTCCSFPVRTGYDRSIGDYKRVPASETASTPPKEESPAEPEQQAVISGTISYPSSSLTSIAASIRALVCILAISG